MGSPLLFVLGLGSVFAIYVVYQVRQNPTYRRILLARLGSRGYHEHEGLEEKRSRPVPSATCRDVLPPLRNPKLTTLPVDASFIPLGKPWEQLSGKKLTPTGFTVDEARDLVGNMPDYAELSGIPLPERVWDDFTIENAQPRPYRPLRWSYHQTMSLMKLDPSYWLELESTYRSRIAQRRQLYNDHKEHVLQCLPGAEVGCRELMEIAVQFVCARYPMYFSISSGGTDRDGKPARLLHNTILDTTTNLGTTHPLRVLLDHIPEDFALMQRNPEDGLYYLRAGVVCSALGWSVGSKMGKVLADVHEPVPDFREKMQFSMDRYFSKMGTEQGVQRGSWGVEKGELLFSPPFPPYSTHLEHARSHREPDLSISDCHFRVDWQTLRRLPVTGFIVFNFKAVFTPLESFRNEPYIPALLRKVLLEGKENIMEYKGTWAVNHVVVPTLEEWIREQEEKGVVEKGWQEETLKESPFFPGWVEKWRNGMGLDEGEDGIGKER